MTDDCDHSGLKEYDTLDRRQLWAAEETVDCPDCGLAFEARRSGLDGDIYLISTEVA
jgi:hypothetical protein